MTSAPVARTWSMYIAFTVPPVPTGMKAGVRTTPRGIAISPRLAWPSVPIRRKENASAIILLVVHRSVGGLPVERLAVADAAAHEFRPGRHRDRRLDLLRQQRPHVWVVPAQIVAARVAMGSDRRAELPHLRDQRVTVHAVEVVIHGHLPAGKSRLASP